MEENKYIAAFEILEKLLEDDKKHGYIRGLVVKQGTLGQYYLKQGEVKSAERVFRSALEFISRKDSSLYNTSWNTEETEAALQIALFNMIILSEALEDKTEVIECKYLEALTKTPSMHTNTTMKILLSLKKLFQLNNRLDDVTSLDILAKEFSFELSSGVGKGNQMKRVIEYILFILCITDLR